MLVQQVLTSADFALLGAHAGLQTSMVSTQLTCHVAVLGVDLAPLAGFAVAYVLSVLFFRNGASEEGLKDNKISIEM